MQTLENAWIDCPYCGEAIEVVVDCSISQQQYIEDCQVCCRPIRLSIQIEEQGEITIKAFHENEC